MADHVEYDLDDRDRLWADQHHLDHELVERVLDRLDKAWFTLTHHLPQDEGHGDGSSEGNCVICDDGEVENLNAIVFCDGCNIAVHQECYGVATIPEEQWLCRRCSEPEGTASCVLCGVTEGPALKRLTAENPGWVHLLCALWIPGVTILNPGVMEPVDVSEVPVDNKALTCSICKRRTGACVQCMHKTCYTAFHPMCGIRNGMYL
ncbi:PHD-zinc-finger like domain-containing protein, partial [Blastocladiella britannica]